MKKIIYSKKEALNNNKIINKIKKGAIFIYPTDTIYGIGCSALNKKSISKLIKIKGRKKKPFSIIAPSKTWIRKNCELKNKKFLKKLPGKFTLIMKLKTKLPKNIGFKNTIGIRIPKHWISNLVKKLKIPITTTSVNKTNKKHMTSLKNLNKDLLKKVNFIIYEGLLNKKPSKIINTINNKLLKR